MNRIKILTFVIGLALLAGCDWHPPRETAVQGEPVKDKSKVAADQHADHQDHDHEDGHDHTDDRKEKGEKQDQDGGGTIHVSTKQQKQLEIETAVPQQKGISEQISATGELILAGDAEVTISAPLTGIISVSRPLPYVGRQVSKGEVVALIEQPLRPDGGAGQLATAYSEAKGRVTLAEQEYNRARQLYEAKVAPRRRLEEAEVALETARAALNPLAASVGSIPADGGKLALRAPVSGTVVELLSGTGRGVEAGGGIIRIVNTERLWLKANLPAIDLGRLPDRPQATFVIPGHRNQYRAGKVISVGSMLDQQSRTLPVIFQVSNSGNRLKGGMFATVSISTGSSVTGLVIPEDALVEDEGRFFVYLQTAAEWFARQEVQIGSKNGGMVQITKGLDQHDKVVTRGSYYVRQAAMAGGKGDPHAGHNH